MGEAFDDGMAICDRLEKKLDEGWKNLEELYKSRGIVRCHKFRDGRVVSVKKDLNRS